MGKANKGAAIVVIFIVAIAFFGILAIALSDEEYGFNYYKTDVDIEIKEDGSMAVSETYNFRWSYTSTGEIYVSFSNDKVSKLNTSSLRCVIDGRTATLVPSYSAGSQATYTGADDMALFYYGTNPISDDWEINAFFKRTTSGNRTVTFQYELMNAVVRYSDCIDLYYKVYTGFSDDLNDLTVTVKMPSGSTQNMTYIFGHGDPNGRCDFIDDTANVLFTSSKLNSFTMFEIRVVSKQTGLYSITPVQTEKTFDSIMAEEEKFRKDTERAIFLANVVLVLIAILLISVILLAVIRYKFQKRNKPTFNHPYTREIPMVKPNIEATFGEYYNIKKKGLGNKITATILNLAVQKAISIESGGGKELVFVSINGNIPMTRFERSVYDMLFFSVKDSVEQRITLSQLKKDLESRTSDNFRLNETDKAEFDAGGYEDASLEPKSVRKNFPFIPLILAVPIIVIMTIIDYMDYMMFLFPVLFVTLIIAAVSSQSAPRPLTKEGENEAAKAKALKKFYTDMTLMKERRAMELPLWEKHLVYATALGVADKVIKELDVRFKELGTAGSYVPSYAYLHVLHNAGLSNSMSSIRSTSNAAFIRSAGPGGSGGGYSSGGGGGFSGGGGGGFGGGGGGHR